MRNPVACVACRSAKQKCIHDDHPPCERCKATGRTESCEFPPPGTSAIHRQPKRPRRDSPQRASNGTSPSNTNSPYQRSHGQNGVGGSHMQPHATGSPPGTAQLDTMDPFELLTDEVKNSYLRCSYKWSFHHTPTLLLKIRDRTLENWMAWAILALAIRFVKEPPPPFRTQTEASNAFATHARQILQLDLEVPSISRVQALLMLTGHDWGAGNGRRAWIYLGMAIRLVEVMDLYREPSYPSDRPPTREEFIEAEVRRRTAWTCFLMDSLLSGGKGRKRSLEAGDMAIQLPCEREDFVFGEAVCTERLDGSLQMPTPSLPVGELGIIAYSLRAANIWGKVARWACSDTVNTELPWTDTSQFKSLIWELDSWKKSLPPKLQYHLFSLHSHNAVDQGQAFIYMHSIYFMSYMFLHRAYLPVLGPRKDEHSDEAPRSYNEHNALWKDWEKTSRKELYKEATIVCDMMEEMRTFGVFFVRGLVPWIGFTIYTAVGVMLYTYNFPSAEDDLSIVDKTKERVIQGCKFLQEMKTQWPMAETWFETIKRMQAYYRSARGEDIPVSPDERRTLRNAMIDYGALQTSPVHKPVDTQSQDNNKVVHLPPIQGPTLPPIQHALPPISPPASGTTPVGYTPSFFNQVQGFQMDGDDSFNLDFDFQNSDVEAMMMNATQDFWASFPGEVGFPTANGV